MVRSTATPCVSNHVARVVRRYPPTNASNTPLAEAGGTTTCPACRTALIGRDWYRLTRWGLVDGRCPGCRATVPGVFERRPGRWGPRRLPVWMGA